MQKDMRKKAAAIEYDKDRDTAPVVTAKGIGRTADRIIEIAKENDIPIHEDKDLIEVLSKVDINQEIPEELYNAIAEVLTFVYKLNNKFN